MSVIFDFKVGEWSYKAAKNCVKFSSAHSAGHAEAGEDFLNDGNESQGEGAKRKAQSAKRKAKVMVLLVHWLTSAFCLLAQHKYFSHAPTSSTLHSSLDLFHLVLSKYI